MLAMSDQLTQFLNRYLLSPQLEDTPEITSHSAAVLVPIIRHPHTPTLLLTQRSDRLRQHPGQVAFPGGKRDIADQTLYDTALRETYEEIGITAASIQLLGELPSVHSRTGHSVKPFLALVQPTFTLNPNPDEVAQVFEIPLRFLTNPQHYAQLTVGDPRNPKTVHFLHHTPQLVWGMTATILYGLAQRITDSVSESIRDI